MEGYFELVVETLTGAGLPLVRDRQLLPATSGARPPRAPQPRLLARPGLPRPRHRRRLHRRRAALAQRAEPAALPRRARARREARRASSSRSTTARERASASCSASASTSRSRPPISATRSTPPRSSASRRLGLVRRAADADRLALTPPRPLPRRRPHGRDRRVKFLQMAELSERKRDILRRVVEEYVATREPVGSKTLVERSGLRLLGVHRPARARRARGARAARRIRTPLPAACRPAPATACTPRRCSTRAEPRPAKFPLDLSSMRSEIEDAAAVDDRDALAGDAAARARLRARPRHGDGAPRRGARAAADARHGRDDHVERRRREEALHVRAAGRRRASPPGRAST